ncbi:hypothetical protein ACFWNC_11490 [Streptomyces sp. NPDC058369]|uniref:hypothetical protein n=1 Tax=Streptomyces sp. NPDC058369 TaxID=3346462 RepID=UPI00365948B9
MKTDPQYLADRYAATWTLSDAAERRASIEDLWARDGIHVLHPPEEIREAAAALGFAHTILEARGYDAIEARVTRSHEDFVEKRGITFRARTDAVRLKRVVKFGWEAVSIESGDVQGGGVEVLLLDEDGRIAADYMYPGT